MGSAPALLSRSLTALTNPQEAMHLLSKRYGPIMSVGLGSDVWVVLSGMEEIKSFCMKDETIDRPESAMFNDVYSFRKPLGLPNHLNCNNSTISRIYVAIIRLGHVLKVQLNFQE